MAALPLQAVAAGTCDATGAATLSPGGGFSPGMFNVWTATAALSRPGASVIALVNGSPVASAYGLTAQLGPVQSSGNSQVSFQVQGDAPGASVSILITGYQASDPNDLPQMGGTGNATIVNIQPQDGAEIVNIGSGGIVTEPGNYVSGLLDVSQWEGIALAVNPVGTQVIGVTLEWFAQDGVTQLGGWASILELPTTGAYAGAQSPFAQIILPNRGPLVQLAANAVTGGPSFQWGANLFQTNRVLGLSNPYSLQGPFLALYEGFSLANGNTQNIPLTGLYSGPATVHLQVPAGPTQLLLQVLDGSGNWFTVWTQNGLTTTQQFGLVIPPIAARFQVTNNSGASQTYTLAAWASATGSS